MIRTRNVVIITLLPVSLASFAVCTGERREAAVPPPAAAAPAASAAQNNPQAALRVAMSDSGPVVALPGPMREALRAYADGFTPWRLEDYDAEVAARAHGADAKALFGTTGDFNGDSVPDVVLQGHDASNELSFVILSDHGRFTAIELLRQPLSEPRTKRRSYVEPMHAGKIDVPPGLAQEVGPPPTLTTDAFAEIFEGQAGTLFYWKDGKFEQYPLGD